MKYYLNKTTKRVLICKNELNDPNEIEFTEELYKSYQEAIKQSIMTHLDVEDDKVIIITKKRPEMSEKAKIQRLRELRCPLLKAFDIYKTNVLYGIINESESEKAEVLKWYQAILDLDKEAIENPLSQIKKYL